jgi:DNA polymerase elongation subunit (family B)
MVLFHILDAQTGTIEVNEVSQTEREITFLPDEEGSVVSDEEFIPAYKQRKGDSSFDLTNKALVIHLFGTTPEGTSVRVSVTGFEPYFYIELPNGSRTTQRIFKTELERRTKYLTGTFRVDYEEKKRLYGYTANKLFPCMKISARSKEALNKLKRIFLDEESKPIFKLNKEGNPLDVYESNLEPLIRFFHLKNIAPCGWVEVPGEPDGEGFLECDWNQVVPIANPPVPSAPFLIAAWDIECYSNSGDFPVPEKDPVIQIGIVLIRAGSQTERHIFVLGSCDPIPGVSVYSYPTEKDMLVGWGEKMVEWNPDILIGYNVFGFDERYMWRRLQQFRLTQNASFQQLSRLADLGEEVKLTEKFLSSAALGDNKLYMWSTHGRLQIDLFHYVKPRVNLTSYKLDAVCSHFMSGKLQSTNTAYALDKWELKTKTTGDVVPGRYVVLLDEIGDVVVDKLLVLEVKAKESVIVQAPSGDDAEDMALEAKGAVKWAVVKDDVSPKEIFALHEGSSADRARIASYCIQDCVLVYDLYKKLEVFNNAMAMANTCPVPVSYIFTRGQGIKIESLIFKECAQNNQIIKVLPTPKQSAGSDESYEGAIVLDPIPGFYFDSPIGVADFASLYPSTIESENISYDTLIWAKDYDLNGNFVSYSFGNSESEKVSELGLRHTIIEFDIKGPHPEDDLKRHPRKINVGIRKCCYAQPVSGEKGTLPTIVRKLLAARKSKRKEAEKEADPFRKALLDAEQLAYKLTANSLYGQLGSSTFKIRLQHLAASVTAYGRKQILTAKAIIERFYGPTAGSKEYCAEITYGDTDSLFVNFNPRNPKTGKRLEGKEALEKSMHLTEEAGKLVTKFLKPPHDFEYDKVFFPFIIFSKKRYVGNKYEESPDSYVQNDMGIALKRRDNAPVVKLIYGGAIRILLTEKNVLKAVDFVKQKTMELVDGKMSLSQLTISKSLRAEYKSVPAHKMLAQRMAARDPGNAPASGDRIPFVYISPKPGQQEQALQGDRIEHPQYVKEKQLKLDSKYYIEHQLMNPLSQLFSLCVEQMPGFQKGDLDDDNSETRRTEIAGELLFREAILKCDKQAAHETATKVFGCKVNVKAPQPVQQPRNEIIYRTETASQPIAVAPKQRQATMDRYMLDSALVEAGKKKKEKKSGSKTTSTNN